jgi:hypothetical protein
MREKIASYDPLPLTVEKPPEKALVSYEFRPTLPPGGKYILAVENEQPTGKFQVASIRIDAVKDHPPRGPIVGWSFSVEVGQNRSMLVVPHFELNHPHAPDATRYERLLSC